MSHIRLRSSGYYFRKVIPIDLRSIFSKQELVLTLDTHSKAIANHRSAYLFFGSISSIMQFNMLESICVLQVKLAVSRKVDAEHHNSIDARFAHMLDFAAAHEVGRFFEARVAVWFHQLYRLPSANGGLTSVQNITIFEVINIMKMPCFTSTSRLLPVIAFIALSAPAIGSTLNQNVSWTIDRLGTTAKYRVTAYGDSIYAGYNGSTSKAALYSAPTVDSEYLSTQWNADIESVRRAKSGAVAKDVYDNKIVKERSYMQHSSTRVVTFEMCGNDGLQARSAFKSQTGTCNYTGIANCKTYVANAMNYINTNAHANVKLKVISNLFYPGYDADNVLSSCTDASTGAKVNMRDVFLPALTKMNYWMCEYARQKGFKCVDSFAEYMGRDYDSNSDGLIDSEALKYSSGESESSYVNRITGTLRPTLRDANFKMVSASSSYDYIQSDNVHPTYSGTTVSAGLWGGTTKTGAPRYTSFTGGKSPIWNNYGHERMGWSLSTHNPATP